MYFKVGDRVTVRDWGEMYAQYEKDYDDDIRIGNSYFTQSMKVYCGKSFEVEQVSAFNHECRLEGTNGEWFPFESLIPYEDESFLEPTTLEDFQCILMSTHSEKLPRT